MLLFGGEFRVRHRAPFDNARTRKPSKGGKRRLAIVAAARIPAHKIW